MHLQGASYDWFSSWFWLAACPLLWFRSRAFVLRILVLYRRLRVRVNYRLAIRYLTADRKVRIDSWCSLYFFVFSPFFIRPPVQDKIFCSFANQIPVPHDRLACVLPSTDKLTCSEGQKVLVHCGPMTANRCPSQSPSVQAFSTTWNSYEVRICSFSASSTCPLWTSCVLFCHITYGGTVWIGIVRGKWCRYIACKSSVPQIDASTSSAIFWVSQVFPLIRSLFQ